MQDDWLRIVAWVQTHAPDLIDAHEPPADRAELAEAERRLSMRLPTAFRAFYGLQNGTTLFRVFPALDADQSAFGPLPIDEVEYFEVEDEDDKGSEEDFEVDPAIRNEFWNPNWIPFAAPQDRGDYLMLDYAPARGGRIGQVIEWRHDTNERLVVAPSLQALLVRIADGLEEGRYVWDKDLGVRRADEA